VLALSSRQPKSLLASQFRQHVPCLQKTRLFLPSEATIRDSTTPDKQPMDHFNCFIGLGLLLSFTPLRSSEWCLIVSAILLFGTRHSKLVAFYYSLCLRFGHGTDLCDCVWLTSYFFGDTIELTAQLQNPAFIDHQRPFFLLCSALACLGVYEVIDCQRHGNNDYKWTSNLRFCVEIEHKYFSGWGVFSLR